MLGEAAKSEHARPPARRKKIEHRNSLEGQVHAARDPRATPIRRMAQGVGVAFNNRGGRFNGPEAGDEFHLDANPSLPFSRHVVTCHNQTLESGTDGRQRLFKTFLNEF